MRKGVDWGRSFSGGCQDWSHREPIEDNIRHYNSVMWENYLVSCQIAGSNADMAILTLNFELVSYNHENEETAL